MKHGRGDMRVILETYDYDIAKIRDFIQSNRQDFPYLAGDKICNYWLFVLLQYTSLPLSNRQALTVAPDTHVLKASSRLDVLTDEDLKSTDVQTICSNAWSRILEDSNLIPIDIHTPLWLWSRLGFPKIV